jgi:DNA polymerase-1
VLVEPKNFEEIVAKLKLAPVLALDTETSGLRPYHGDKLFCVILHDGATAYYFGFHPEHPGCLSLVYLSLLQLEIFADASKTWAIHNASFDAAILANYGCYLAGTVHCTKAIARVIENDRLASDLATCAREIGLEKSEAVEDYIREHGLSEKVRVPGKSKRITLKHFDKVPFEIIHPYGETDTEITFALYEHQVRAITNTALQTNLAPGWVPLTDLMHNERSLTKVLFDMQQIGVMIDVGFCERAAAFEAERSVRAAEEFKVLTGHPYKKSSKLFKEIFDGEKFIYGKPTKKKGEVNPKFDADTLATFKSPVAKLVVELTSAKSQSDYYNGFLWHADAKGRIHCDFNQDGAKTGRFSSSNPNLQNLKKSEGDELDQEFVVRRAIIPTPGKLFVMFDYEQMEYRLLLDYLGTPKLIKLVLEGLDVHQATASIAGITRSSAKTVNFATIYGSGIGRLAKTLGCSRAEAVRIQAAIFAAIPELEPFITKVQNTAVERKFVRNWFGRRCNFPPSAKLHSAVNHLIQGGCADVVKIAMVRIHEFLRPYQTKMVLNVHDECIVECVPQEVHLLPKIKEIMENVYRPIHGLPLSCGVAHSYKSLADKIEGYPIGAENGNTVQDESGHLSERFG